MYLERLSVQGVDANNNPNKYFKPGGQFNTAQQYADIMKLWKQLKDFLE